MSLSPDAWGMTFADLAPDPDACQVIRVSNADGSERVCGMPVLVRMPVECACGNVEGVRSLCECCWRELTGGSIACYYCGGRPG